MSEAHSRSWPKPLRTGDLVTVVAPSGPCNPDRVRRGAKIIESWGLTVRFGQHALGAHDQLSYLSAADQTRAVDFTTAWSDRKSAAVWAARGGYGAQRMLDQIDFAALRAAGAKHFIGFSDVTALHTRIGRELEQVTIHGPVVGSLEQLSDPVSVDQLRRMITEPPVSGALLCSGLSVVSGTATGVLTGGNLSLVVADLGIEPLPSRPTIVVLEDIDEEGYRIDRMLTQLHRAGWFERVVGIVVGDFTGAGDAALRDRVVADRLDALGVPLIRGARVGHGERNLALPLGAAVRLVADPGGDGALTLL